MENKCYIGIPITKNVSEEEFNTFLENYPRELEQHVVMASEPHILSYNDFELAPVYPQSVVATTPMYSDDPNSYWYVPKDKRLYIITINYEELFNNKIKYKA